MASIENRSDVTCVRLERFQLQALLLRFEDQWFEATGDRMTSASFYARYTAGEFDSPFGMAWATYYEALLRQEGEPSSDDGAVSTVFGAVPRVCV